MTKIEALATEMGVTVNDAISFATCIQHWINKGLTMEQAIERHMMAMRELANNAVALSQELKPLAVEWFYEGRA